MRKFLRSGGIVAVPTETVYGLAANALDPEACARIFKAKGRPADDPLICHVTDYAAIESLCHGNELSSKLAEAFWPGPLTIVLPKKPVVPDLVTAGLPSVAVRCPKHPAMSALLRECGFPLAAPSANPFAYISPTCAAHVEAGLGDRIEYIIDGGPCELGIESTIVDARDPDLPRILRHGALTKETIEAALGRSIDAPRLVSKEATPQLAPGSLPKHYSPRTPLEVRTTPIAAYEIANARGHTAFILLAQAASVPATTNVFPLSRDGQLSEIAANLYRVLREADASGCKKIIAEEAAELGLGAAINDRLRRAAKK